MLKIHPEALPLIIEGDRQVGWLLLTDDFELHAILQLGKNNRPSENVVCYINWGEDQKIDISEHKDMNDVKLWLEGLLRTSYRSKPGTPNGF